MIKRILALLTGLALALGLGIAAANPAAAATVVVNDQATYTLPNTHFVHNNGVVDTSRPGTVTIRLVYTQSTNSLGQPTVSPGNHTNGSPSYDIRIQNNSNAKYPYGNLQAISVAGFLLKDRNSANTGWEEWASAIANISTVTAQNMDALPMPTLGCNACNVAFYGFYKTTSGGHAQYNIEPSPAGYDNLSEGRDVGVGYRFARYLPVAGNSRPTFSGIPQWRAWNAPATGGTIFGIETPIEMTNP